MTSSPLRRWLSVAITAVIFVPVLTLLYLRGPDGASGVQADSKKGPADGPNWPLFGGTLERNLVNLFERDMPTDWSIKEGAEKNIKWAINLGSKAYGGPVFYRGKIFIGTNNEVPRDPKITGDKGVLMCFQENDGKFLWQAIYDKLAAGRVQDWPKEGICSSPFVEGNRVYFVNNRSEVVCADIEGDEAGKAKEIWKLNMISQLNTFTHNLSTCSPLVAGDMLFVITSNGVDEDHLNVPSPEAPSFLAIDKKTGKIKWQDNSPSRNLVEARKVNKNIQIKELVDKGQLLMHGQWSNPVYAEPNGKPQIIFPGGDGWVRAFHPGTGELIWKFDCNPKDSFYVLGPEATRNDFVSTPVVWQNKLYIGVGQDPEHKKGVGHLWCIDISKEPKNKDKDLSPGTKPGEKKDDPPQTVFDPKDPVNKDSGLVWHYGGLAPETSDYDRNYYFGRTLSTCAVNDGLCYAGEYDGVVHCLDANTGQHYWEHNMKSDTWSSPYWVDGKVYIGNENGRMLIFEHGKKKKLLNEIRMGSSATHIRATPVAINGTLYVMTENPCRLYAITKK
jgi:outer membrane protein assembly factor BamB